MVMLLKQKSKITLQRKPRVKYEIKPIFKRPKVDSSITAGAHAQLDATLGLSGPGKTSKKIEPQIIEKYDDPMQGK